MVCNILLSDFVDLFCDRPLFEKKKWRWVTTIESKFHEHLRIGDTSAECSRKIDMMVVWYYCMWYLSQQFSPQSGCNILPSPKHLELQYMWVWVQNACLKNWQVECQNQRVYYSGVSIFDPAPKSNIHCLLRQHLGYDLGCWLPSGEVFGLDSSIMLDS